jgi:hypothetical protein
LISYAKRNIFELSFLLYSQVDLQNNVSHVL